MAVATLSEIRAGVRLVGFWQFASAGKNYLAVLEQAGEATRSELTLSRWLDGRWQAVKTIASEDGSILAIHGASAAHDLVFGLELNSHAALEITRVELASWVDAANRATQFSSVAELHLSEAQVARVQLPISKWWNVAGSLAPARWLFNPQLVRVARGALIPPQLIANTSDGQAMLFSSAQPDPALETFSIPNAAEPQAFVVDGERVVAFKRTAEPYYPYWSLSRYSGTASPTGGNLMVATAPTAMRDLSKELSIGPVVAFSLVAAPDGKLWIFALCEEPVGTGIIALTRRGPEWAIAGRWSVNEDVSQLSAEYGADRWHIVCHVPTETGWSLKYQAWQPL